MLHFHRRGYRHAVTTMHHSNLTDRRRRLGAARLYLCTDARREKGDLAQFAEAALSGGVDIIQLRDKGSAGEKKFGTMDARDELAALSVLAAAARRHGALLAVNDRADMALAAGADVLHLGQGDLPVPYARTVVGADVLIGRSTHSRAQASLAAIEDGVDYFCTGPVWATPTKPGRTASGIDLVRIDRRLGAEPPVVRDRRHRRVPRSGDPRRGGPRIVVVRAITEARDPQAAARSLSALLQQNA